MARPSGRIVNVSSGAANLALPSIGAYCTSKAALNHFSRILAVEEPELTTLAVRPGVVDTDMQAFIREKGSSAVPPDQAGYYRQLKDRGELVLVAIPARSKKKHKCSPQSSLRTLKKKALKISAGSASSAVRYTLD